MGTEEVTIILITEFGLLSPKTTCNDSKQTYISSFRLSLRYFVVTESKDGLNYKTYLDFEVFAGAHPVAAAGPWG